MGCASSRFMDPGEKDSYLKNQEIDAHLAKERESLRKQVKLLLLGTGESGKSTVMKQMLLIYSNGFNDSDRRDYIDVIYANTVQSLQAILGALPLLELEVEAENHPAAAIVESLDPDVRLVDPITRNALLTLCRDSTVLKAVKNSDAFQLNNSADYFFQAVERTTEQDYLPSDADMIRARVRTTGIQENRIRIGDLEYRIFDVGGQRSERKKWIHCFEDVTSLLFICAISEYNEMLFEDETVGRLGESLVVFTGIANSRWFAKSSVVLFLNKIDIFREKLERFPIKSYFPAYNGAPTDYEAGLLFFLEQFKSRYKQENRLYHHYTQATDTKALKSVVEAINDTLTRKMLQEVMGIM